MATEIDVECTDERIAPCGALGTMRIAALGANNIRNALGACAVGLALGISFDAIVKGMAEFGGVQRRMQFRGVERGVTVIEDYAHHPTEIASTLDAAAQLNPGRIVVVFQPHLYSRTKYLHAEFASVLSGADAAFVTDIYGAREEPIPGVTSELIMSAAGKTVEHVGDMNAIPGVIAPRLRERDVVLILGAGNINRIAGPLLEALRAT